MLSEKYKKDDIYEVELYSTYKPKKELKYTKKLESPRYPHFCPWCPNLFTKTEFEISRKLTEKEEDDFGKFMTLTMLRCTFESDAEKGDKKAIKELIK